MSKKKVNSWVLGAQKGKKSSSSSSSSSSNSIYCSGLSLLYLLLVTSPEFPYSEFDTRERLFAQVRAV
jgi:hypothetical protein